MAATASAHQTQTTVTIVLGVAVAALFGASFGATVGLALVAVFISLSLALATRGGSPSGMFDVTKADRPLGLVGAPKEEGKEDDKEAESSSDTGVRVVALNLYPVKSCAGIALQEATVTAGGIEHDREWMIVREGSSTVEDPAVIVTARMFSKVGAIQPSFDDKSRLVLTVPLVRSARALDELKGVEVSASTASLAVTSPRKRVLITALVWRTKCDGIDQGDDVAAFLSAYLGAAVRLIRMPGPDRLLADCDKYRTLLSAEKADTTDKKKEDEDEDEDKKPEIREDRARFSDWSSFSIGSMASMRWLNEELAKRGLGSARGGGGRGGGDAEEGEEREIGIHRFRLNIWVDGDGNEPFLDDGLKRFQLLPSSDNDDGRNKEGLTLRRVKGMYVWIYFALREAYVCGARVVVARL